MNTTPFPSRSLPFARPKQPVKSLEEILAPAVPPPVTENKIIFMHVGDKPAAEPKPATRTQGLAALDALAAFMHPRQIKVVRNCMYGEERQFFIDKMIELAAQVKAMPHTYQQDGLGEQAIAHLHYFVGGCDWWITEKDKGDSEDTAPNLQIQAFGYACLGDPTCAELGYVSLPEILNAGAELDFHWNPTALAEIKAKIHA